MLTKLPRVTITPAVPFVQGRPESIVCPALPPDSAPTPPVRSGYYVRLCVRPFVTLANGRRIYVDLPICTSVWVDSGE